MELGVVFVFQCIVMVWVYVCLHISGLEQVEYIKLLIEVVHGVLEIVVAVNIRRYVAVRNLRFCIFCSASCVYG